MAQAGTSAARPLSPHLTIFRPYINMMMSIIHRATGVANYFGTLLIVFWLSSAAAGGQSYAFANEIAGSIIGLIILFGFSWSLIHHALGGLRHFIWDTGRGFSIPSVRLLSWLTILGSISITIILWAAILLTLGAL
jgi:succinate dehydrogenase / fumarate reductase cytochrome b subunit